MNKTKIEDLTDEQIDELPEEAAEEILGEEAYPDHIKQGLPGKYDEGIS